MPEISLSAGVLSISRRVVLLLGLFVFTALMCHTAFSQSAPLKVEDALGTLPLAPVMPIALSPDGDWLAYTVQDNRRLEIAQSDRDASYSDTGAITSALGCDIWITNTVTGKSHSLTEGKGTSSGPVWSPDGKYLAFYSDRSGTERLWLWERDSGVMRQLSAVTPRPYFTFEVVRWTPDSRHIVAKVLPEGMGLNAAADLINPPSLAPLKENKLTHGPSVTVYSSDPTPEKGASAAISEKSLEVRSWMNRYLGDLALIDVANGKVEHLVTGIKPIGYWISPNGKHLAYLTWKGNEVNTQQAVYQLDVFSLDDRKLRVLVPQVKQDYGMSVSWSPDSSSLAYTTSENGSCYLVSVNGGEPQNVTPGAHPPFTDFLRAPLWDARGEFIYFISREQYGRVGSNEIWAASTTRHSLRQIAEIPDHVILEVVAPVGGGRFWSPDGRSIVVLARNEKTKVAGFYNVAVPDGAITLLFEEPRYFGETSILTTDIGRAGQVIAYAAEDSQHPQDIWLSGPNFRDRRRVTRINPQIESVSFGQSRLIDWRGIDGQELHGALLLPVDYQPGKRYPLVVNVYGGSYLSSDTYRFGVTDSGVDNLQLLATRGYAVLSPDTPLRRGTPMQDLLKTVMPGVDRAIDLGIADPERLGVMGHSYGGYSTLALIVQTTRFKAAADRAGGADLISFYGDLDKSGAAGIIGWAETGQGGMVGTPWQNRTGYIENSPLFYLDRVQTPVLIVQGDLDPTWQQAEEVFVGLRRLGKEVVYAKYHGEDHWEGTWSVANINDFWTRVFDWFDRHLSDGMHDGSTAH